MRNVAVGDQSTMVDCHYIDQLCDVISPDDIMDLYHCWLNERTLPLSIEQLMI